jgi:hypothetical protein
LDVPDLGEGDVDPEIESNDDEAVGNDDDNVAQPAPVLSKRKSSGFLCASYLLVRFFNVELFVLLEKSSASTSRKKATVSPAQPRTSASSTSTASTNRAASSADTNDRNHDDDDDTSSDDDVDDGSIEFTKDNDGVVTSGAVVFATKQARARAVG